jgi:putative transposase
MPRRSRLFIPGCPVHAIQRGHSRNAVFRDEFDYQNYQRDLFEAVAELGIALHAYVLMPNHIHLLLTAPTEHELARLFQSIGRRYVRYFNKRYGSSGSLWEGRFKSGTIESERYLVECYRYIDLNPVRAGIVEAPEQYKYSSFRHHAGLDLDPRIQDHEVFWRLGNTPFDRQNAYRHVVAMAVNADRTKLITDHALRGRHLGAEAKPAFQKRVGLGRRGRPKKVLAV